MLSPEWTPAARTSTFARTRTTTGKEASTASLPARTTAKKRRRVLDDASTGTANTRSVYALCPSAGTWPRCGSVQPAQLTRPSAASADIPQVVRAHADVRYADDRCRRLTALAAARLPLPGPEGEVITDRLEFLVVELRVPRPDHCFLPVGPVSKPFPHIAIGCAWPRRAPP